MTEHQQDPLFPKGDILGRAIRSASSQTPPGFLRPSDETISDYFMGVANDTQKEEMLLALEQSSDFRKEMIGLVRDLQSLPAPKPVPSPVPQLDARTRTGFLESASNALAWLFPTPSVRLATIAVTFALVAIAVWQLQRGTEQLTNLAIMVSDLPASQLIATTSRGADTSVGELVSSAEEAALIEMRKFVDYDSAYMLLVRDTLAAIPPNAKTCQIVLLDSLNRELTSLELVLDENLSEASLWISGISSDNHCYLLSAPLKTPTMRVLWRNTLGIQGSSCIVYKVPGGFKATRGSIFRVSDVRL